jgi:hypothetical protein
LSTMTAANGHTAKPFPTIVSHLHPLRASE